MVGKHDTHIVVIHLSKMHIDRCTSQPCSCPNRFSRIISKPISAKCKQYMVFITYVKKVFVTSKAQASLRIRSPKFWNQRKPQTKSYISDYFEWLRMRVWRISNHMTLRSFFSWDSSYKLTGSWFGSSASTNVLACPSVTSLCCTLGPWHITTSILALIIWRQWWVHSRIRVLGVHFWRVPTIRLCIVILLCKILSIWLGSQQLRMSRGVLCTCMQFDSELDFESSFSSTLFSCCSLKCECACPSWLIRRSLRPSEKCLFSAVFSSLVSWLLFRFGVECL